MVSVVSSLPKSALWGAKNWGERKGEKAYILNAFVKFLWPLVYLCWARPNPFVKEGCTILVKVGHMSTSNNKLGQYQAEPNRFVH